VADDELAAAIAEKRAVLITATQDASGATITDMLFRCGLAAGAGHAFMRAVEAAVWFHERTGLYGNAATEDEPGACPHGPGSPLHFEDGDGSGECLCEGKPEGAVCRSCTEDGLPVAWPCPEYSAILAALNGRKG
jgi:hypothetical protein